MKEQLRSALLKKRSQLSASSQKDKSSKIIDNVCRSSAFIKANKIAFYHAVRGEADPAGLVQKAILQGSEKQFYLPVLSTQKDQGMIFAPLTTKTKFKNNKYAIPEPDCATKDLITADKLDLVIVPLLGFDRQGNRLGMGGGYYDSCFSFRKLKRTKPLLVGFAYDFQEVQTLDTEAWDVGLDMIATESELITLS